MDGHQPAVRFDLDAFLANDPLLLLGLVDGCAQVRQQTFAGHSRQAKARLPGSGFQKGARSPAEEKDFQVFVHHHACRDVLGQENALRLFLRVESGRRLLHVHPGFPLSRSKLGGVEFKDGPRHRRFLRVDLVLLVQQLKVLVESCDALRDPEHQKAARVQAVIEEREHLFLQHEAQINQQIAATYQVQSGEGRVLGHIVPGKNAHVANGFADLVSLRDFREKATQAFWRHIGGDVH